MNRLCRLLVICFALLYLAALCLLAVGTFGLFGNERDPLAGVFLMPLGLPWNLLFDRLPDPLLPWLGAGAPLINFIVLWLICRMRRGRGRAAPSR